MRLSLRLFSIFWLPVACIAGDFKADFGNNACVKHEVTGDVYSGELSLETAIQSSLQHHPALRLAGCQIMASDGRLVQAGLRPNPEASVAVENFAGSGTRSGLNAAETTLQVSQLIELGGKRGRRIALANSEREIASWELASQRLSIVTGTRLAFIDVLVAQARLELAVELSALAKSLSRGVATKVKAGKVSPIEESRAMVDVSRADIAVTAAQSRLEASRQRLALNWGESGAHFTRALGTLETLPTSPPLAQVLQQIDHNPALARWPSEMKRRDSALQLASAMGVSNIVLSGGLRQFADSDDVGIVVGLSVPLPLFNRNQGAILAAQADMAAADAGLSTDRLALLNEVHTQYQALQTARAEEESLRTRVLPLARRVLKATSEGYRQGKFGLMEVLDAQRIVFESRAVHVEAMASRHRAAAQLEGLIGTGLDKLADVDLLNPEVYP